MISYKFHQAREIVLALADKELLGKKFSEGEKILTVNNFFRGEIVEEEEIKDLVKKATIINAVGDRVTKAIIDAGLANKSAIKTVENIPHIQTIIMD
ncbi:MAG: DUF424 family protein [Candidatus Altiarchaeota archaeon]|nr:DUF424 family protein [Candidatus Altiarchaeota archaeon]